MAITSPACRVWFVACWVTLDMWGSPCSWSPHPWPPRPIRGVML